jgi:hypothetical protein
MGALEDFAAMMMVVVKVVNSGVLVYCSVAVLPEQGVGWQFEKDITRTMIVLSRTLVSSSKICRGASRKGHYDFDVIIGTDEWCGS